MEIRSDNTGKLYPGRLFYRTTIKTSNSYASLDNVNYGKLFLNAPMIGPNALHNRFADTAIAAAAGVVLVDTQAAVRQAAGSTAARLTDNLVGLVRVATAFGAPILVTTRRDAGALIEPVAALVAPGYVIERPNQEVFGCDEVRDAIQALGRRILFLACWGVGEDIADIAVGAVRAGFDVRIVVDASSPLGDADDYRSIARMTSAGVAFTTWVAVLAALSHELPAGTLQGEAQQAIRESLATYSPDVPSSWSAEAARVRPSVA